MRIELEEKRRAKKKKLCFVFTYIFYSYYTFS